MSAKDIYSRKLRILLAIMMLLPACLLHASEKESLEENENPEMHLVSELSSNKVMVGECVTYTLTLYSTSKNIEGIRLMQNVDVKGMSFEQINANTSWTRSKYKGRECYAAKVGVYSIDCEEAGSYKIGGWKYAVGVQVPRQYRDPFFGYIQSYEVRSVEVESTVEKLKVKALPEKYASLPAGEFSIDFEVPPGYIKPGDTSIAIVTVAGTGIMPDIESLKLDEVFRNAGLKLVETRPQIRNYVKNGRRMRELEVECTFIAPESQEYTLAPVELKYYDTKQQRVVTTASEVVVFEAGKMQKRSEPPVIQEI